MEEKSEVDPRRRQQNGERRGRGRGRGRGGNRPRVPRAARVQEDASNVKVVENDVFVKRLPRNVDEEQIRAAFGKYGKIQNVRLSRRIGRVFASVSFEASAEAQKAIADGSNIRIGDAEVEVSQFRSVTRPREAKPQQQQQQQQPQQQQQKQQKQQKQQQQQPAAEADPKAVWIGNLETTATVEDVTKFATPFGKIAKVDRRQGNRFAIVTFETVDAAKQAAEKGNGAKIGENEVKVEAARPPRVRAAAQPKANNTKANNDAATSEPKKAKKPRNRKANPARIFVGGVTDKTQEDVSKIFASYGEISKVVIRRGHALVTFADVAAANAALAKNNTEIFEGSGACRVELSKP